jgi:hypothetical protein
VVVVAFPPAINASAFKLYMPKKISDDLKNFLKPFPADVQKTALWLRKFVWDTLPDVNELIYDNYNALVIGFGLSDHTRNVFCSVAVYSKYSNFGFLPGDVPDPKKLLKGTGNVYRYITVNNIEDFPVDDIKKMLADAWINAASKLKGEQTLKGATMVKSVSPKKRRPA